MTIPQPTPHTSTGVQAADFKEFDYVIVGGGTAGLAIAARLSEDPAISVGVIEAGLWRPKDPKINYPAFIGQSLMDPDYDWCLETVPQSHSNGRKYAWPRGKVLGGSSALNFLVWQRGYKGEFDDLEKLGNQGWNWDDFSQFSRKSSTLHQPSTQLQKDNFATPDPLAHGTSGPVQTSYSLWYTEAQLPWFKAMKELGLNNAVDGLDGNNSGVWASPATVDAKNHVRSYAASAYYSPNAHRENLKVITGALASKIELGSDRDANGELKATGVSFDVEGQSYTVKARKEVILSAGTIKSPQILELSGIGSSDVLSKLGIDVKVESPGVGENLQEHLYCASSFKLKPGFTTWDKMRQSDFAKAAMEQYHGEGEDRGIIASAFSGFAYVPLSQYMTKEEIQGVKDKVNQVDWSKYSKGIQETIKLQLDRLEDESCPFMEYIFAPGFFATASPPKDGAEYFSILSALMQPFSRGTIHAQSTNPKDDPLIDPKYFSVDADLDVLAKGVNYCDKIVSSPSLKEIVVERQDPNPEVYKEEKDFREYVKDQSVSEYHHLGTCSMMPKDKDGVVNERLKVYGVANLRVADASIIPFQISSHIQAAVYAIGEKAAHMILEDARRA
ncbi:alcohol oxidase [Violaceomyces palustris]|uniref:Alcohol oxidase n=1 Tax=Violaceomyces palustris TaxID=1673888 RepID=A0ACD0NS32_9BASI|nr:alcohol oxidase [Violaceomyces palustris]